MPHGPMILMSDSDPFQIVRIAVLQEPDGKYLVDAAARHNDGRIKGVEFLLEGHRDAALAIDVLRQRFTEDAPDGR